MERVVLAHGINTEGHEDVFKLQPFLEDYGYRVVLFEYKMTRSWNALFYRKGDARSLKRVIKRGDHFIGHSNGCALCVDYMKLPGTGDHLDKVIFIAAAVPRDVVFPAQGFNRLLNVWNIHDKALRWGRFLKAFGDLGRVGYRGPDDDRVIPAYSPSHAGPYDHTAPYFDDEYVGKYAKDFHDFIKTGNPL